MRAIANEIRNGDYKFVMEFDSGGDPEVPFTLWIYKNNEPLLYKDSEIQVRKEFQKNYNKRHLQNFCLKFVNNEVYRRTILEGK